jgi:hypothetical protein
MFMQPVSQRLVERIIFLNDVRSKLTLQKELSKGIGGAKLPPGLPPEQMSAACDIDLSYCNQLLYHTDQQVKFAVV